MFADDTTIFTVSDNIDSRAPRARSTIVKKIW